MQMVGGTRAGQGAQAPPALCRAHTVGIAGSSIPWNARQGSANGRQSAGCRRSCRHRRRLFVAAIGFDLPGAEVNNKSAEKHAEELTRAAASLLLYSSVLRGKPAQAFLGVLQLLQKGNPLSLLQQYGEMYRLLAAEDFASWQDYLLDQVIKGVDNPLAKAAAAGKPTRHLHKAAAHDLDLLQQLAVAERTLAGWVKATAYGVTDDWLEAACCLAPEGGAPGDEAAAAAAAAAHKALLEEPFSLRGYLLAPLSEAERAGLRAELAGKWRWSEGVELLARYYAAHGSGLVSQHSVLAWTGKLQAQDVLKGAHDLAAAEEEGLVAAHHHAATTLVAALTQFLSQDMSKAASPPHVAVCGDAVDRWLYTAWALQQVGSQVPAELQQPAAGLRTLVLPTSQLGSLADLAWSLSQHPRCRFVVVVTGVEGGLSTGDLAATLSGYDGFSWPSNALVVAGFPAAPSSELAPVFKHTATIEDRFAA